MRTHNHLEIKRKCEESIPDLMNKYQLGKIQTLFRDDNGWVNPCFFINDRYVFRFNARDPGLPKFQREFFVFDILRKNKIAPVPSFVILDDSKELIEYDVLISEMISGKNIERNWKTFSTEEKELIAFEAGTYLPRLHTVEFNYFGEIAGVGPLPRTQSWIDFLKAKLTMHFNEARTLNLFSKETEALVWSILDQKKSTLAKITKATLVHGDYHLGNLLTINHKITGVLDFEWSFAGDSLYDYCQWRTPNELWEGSHLPFLKASHKLNFSADEVERLDVYQMIHNIELCVVAALHFSPEELKDYLKTTTDQIQKLNKQKED